MLQVTTPALSTALTTLEAVQLDLGVDADPRLGALIEQASAVCVGYCGRPFGRASYIQTIREFYDPLVLIRTPVVTLTSVSWGDGTSAADPLAYMLDAEAGLLYERNAVGRNSPGYLDRTWYGGYGGCLQVAYTAGYNLPNDDGRDLPHDVERAAIEMVKMLWFSSGAGSRDPAIRSEVVEGIGSTSYRDPVRGAMGLPQASMDLLTPYRRNG